MDAKGGEQGALTQLASGDIGGLSADPTRVGRVVISETHRESEIVRAEIRADGNVGPVEVVPAASSTKSEIYPAISPDGQRLAFVSDRSGLAQVWVTDGNGAKQVTNIGVRAAAPRWSPDGQSLVCAVVEGKGRWITVVPLNGGAPRRLHDEARPSWSADGRWIYFTKTVADRAEIWKIAVTGGAAERVTENGGHEGVESPDGKSLFYLKGPQNRELVRKETGRAEEQIAAISGEGTWAVTRSTVWFFAPGRERTLLAYSLRDRRVREVGRVPGMKVGLGFSASLDDRWLFGFSRAAAAADLQLLEEQR